jgi:hypothetical protein
VYLKVGRVLITAAERTGEGLREIGTLLVGSAYAADRKITVVRVTPSLDLAQAQYILSHQREEVFEQGMALDSKQWQMF